MADQDIEALMGLMQPNDPGQGALANALRGQQKMGEFYSMSPTLQKQGESMQTRALNTAKVAGDRRQQGLTRARQAEQDALAKRKWEQTLKGYSDIKQYTTPEGEIQTWGTNNMTGRQEQIPDMAGLTEYDSPTSGKDTWSIKLATGEHALAHKDGSVTIPGIGKFATLGEAEQAASLGRVTDSAAAKEAAVDWASEEVEDAYGRVQAINELDGSMASSDRAMDQIVAAIDDGATSGRLYDLIPTWTNATAQLESAKSKETLASLGKYKLTPVSDRDLAELRKEAVPNLAPAALREWALHKKEGLRRIRAANRIMESFLMQNRKPPTPDQRDKLRKEMDEILYADGYSFAHRLNADTGTETVTEEVTVSPGVDTETGVTTLSDGSRWNADGTPAQ